MNELLELRRFCVDLIKIEQKVHKQLDDEKEMDFIKEAREIRKNASVKAFDLVIKEIDKMLGGYDGR